ncbi:uncharacterized protein [Eurosta solidaginis]|uniref:uncharacterized protein n=1 Tax=Eurosta solidaginis TaxID=178769 RepID=UPI003530CA20
MEKFSTQRICVTESWFKVGMKDLLYTLCDYSLIRNDRSTGNRGGGIAIYFKPYLQCKVIHVSGCTDLVDSIFVEFYDNVQKCLVVCIYNPHNSNDFTIVFNKTSELSMHYVHVLICGDFTIDILSDSNRSRNLLCKFNSVGITIANKYATRFAPQCRPIMLDLFGASDTRNIMHIDQFPLAGISDHELILLSYDVEFSKTKNAVKLMYRDFKKINMNGLQYESLAMDWNYCYLLPHIDDKLSYFLMLVNYLYEKYVPISTTNAIDNKKLWFNNRILQLIKKRNNAYKYWKRNPSTERWREYKKLRNKLTTDLRQAKINYLKTKFNDNVPSKILWKNLKSLGVRPKADKACVIDANLMNSYFIGINRRHDLVSKFVVNQSLEYNHSNKLAFVSGTEDEIAKCVYNIKSNAVGVDGLSLRFLYSVEQSSQSILTLIG